MALVFLTFFFTRVRHFSSLFFKQPSISRIPPVRSVLRNGDAFLKIIIPKRD